MANMQQHVSINCLYNFLSMLQLSILTLMKADLECFIVKMIYNKQILVCCGLDYTLVHSTLNKFIKKNLRRFLLFLIKQK